MDLNSIDNTLKNRHLFNTPQEAQIRTAPMASTYQPNQGTIVSFRVDLQDMFGVNLDYPGMRQALNSALQESRHYVPVDTGLLRRSYKLRILSDTEIEAYFDPLDIIGQQRKGKTVKEYYPQWVGSSGPDNKAWNWLTIVMSHFYDSLISAVRALRRRPAYRERQAEGRSVPVASALALAVQSQARESVKEMLKERKEARQKAEKARKDEITRQKQIRALVKQRREA